MTAPAPRLMAPPSWSLDFVPHGTRLQSPLDDGTVALDIGNAVPEDGIYDHHQGGVEAACTAALVFRNRSRLRTQLNGQPERTVFLHENPDFDALTSFFLAWCLVSKPSNPNPSRFQTLVDFASRVDQGRARPTNTLTLYTFVLMAGTWLTSEQGASFRHSTRMRRIFEDGRIDAPSASTDACTAALTLQLLRDWSATPEWAPPDTVDPTIVSKDLRPVLFSLDSRLNRQMDCCKQDIERAQAAGDIGQTTIQTKDGSPQSALYVRVVNPESNPGILGKYIRTWSRRNYDAPAVSLLQFREGRRTIASVPPESTLTLKGLGLYLERMEQEERKRQGMEDEDVPRYQAVDPDGTVHVDPLFEGSDPWYDGRGHNFTIVDTPRSGSLLSLEEVYQAVVNAGWMECAAEYESSAYQEWKAHQQRS